MLQLLGVIIAVSLLLLAVELAAVALVLAGVVLVVMSARRWLTRL